MNDFKIMVIFFVTNILWVGWACAHLMTHHKDPSCSEKATEEEN